MDEDPSAKNSHIGNGLSYTKENTPLDFRISITYAFSEDFSDKLTYDVTGYVSQFSNWKETVFITEEKYKECEDDNFSKYRNIAPWHSPLRYYKIFYKK